MPRSRRARPIESVELRVAITSESATAERLKGFYPAGKTKDGVFELTLKGEAPSDVAAAARDLLERVKLATAPSKDFK